MKLIKFVLAIIFLFLLTSFLVSIYLGPDKLRFCNEPSSGGDCAKVDAIVVVSGGDTKARTAEAIKLYKQGYAPVIVFSGAAADKSGPSNAKVMQRQAMDAGVPWQATKIEERSETTGENAENTMRMAKQNGYKSIILVTSAYHQRRALLEFNYYGKGVDIKPHPVSEDKDWNRYWFLTPWGWNLAISEIIKSSIAATSGVDRT